MKLYTAIIGSLFAGISLAVPAPSEYVRHQTRNLAAPHLKKWIKRSRAPAEAEVVVSIALAQRNLARGHDMLMDISNPSSSNYGKHLSLDQVARMFAPEPTSISSIRNWLHSAGVDAERHVLTPSLGYLKFNATISEAEALLQTQYHVFEHSQTGDEYVACDEYHVPGDMSRHIDFVSPTINLHRLKKRMGERSAAQSNAGLPPKMKAFTPPASILASSSDLSLCDAFVTIDCIRAAYGIPVGNTSQPGNELGIFETENMYDTADLNTFYSMFAPNVPQNTMPTLDSVDGGMAPVAQEDAGDESVLDFELAIPLVYPQKTILYQVDDPNRAGSTEGFQDTFLDALDKSFCTFRGGDNPTFDPVYPDPLPGGFNHTEMCGTYKPTNVISVSYGLPEGRYDRLYVHRTCQEYMKLGLAGTTVVIASGDAGVASDEGCFTNPQNDTLFAFTPDYPADCPYVTAVGATQFTAGEGVHGTQVVANNPNEGFSSGGGFSGFFEQPDYQVDAVQSYITNFAPTYPDGTYKKKGRAYPDVSAVGQSIVTWTGGRSLLGGGTSASTPIFASIITLINEQRLAVGKRPVGFVNPVLYAHPEAFQDITQGNNPGCGTQGFDAATGWDPASGLGTPKFAALLKVFMDLP